MGPGPSLQHATSLGNIEYLERNNNQHHQSPGRSRNYDSEDENMGRRQQHQQHQQQQQQQHPRSTSSGLQQQPRTSVYSKGDIREQYCLSDKQLNTIETSAPRRDRFFGCWSARSAPHSILGVCVGRRAPSDENLNSDYAPFYKYPRYSTDSVPYQLRDDDDDDDPDNYYFKRRPTSFLMSGSWGQASDGKPRYTWTPANADTEHQLEAATGTFDSGVVNRGAYVVGSYPPRNYLASEYVSGAYRCPAHIGLPPPPPPPSVPPDGLPHPVARPKHVSFARSHTLTSFDEVVVHRSTSRLNAARSQERLIGGKKPTPQPLIPTGAAAATTTVDPSLALMVAAGGGGGGAGGVGAVGLPVQIMQMPAGVIAGAGGGLGLQPQQQQQPPAQQPHLPQHILHQVAGFGGAGTATAIVAHSPHHYQHHLQQQQHQLADAYPVHLVQLQPQHQVQQIVPVQMPVQLQPQPQPQPPDGLAAATAAEKPLKRSGVKKTQATQTDLSRKLAAAAAKKLLQQQQQSTPAGPVHKVKMVSHGSQVNGSLSSRKLTKSLSEVAYRMAVQQSALDPTAPRPAHLEASASGDHEFLYRTQSEDPNRSPCDPAFLSRQPRREVDLVVPDVDDIDHDDNGDLASGAVGDLDHRHHHLHHVHHVHHHRRSFSHQPPPSAFSDHPHHVIHTTVASQTTPQGTHSRNLSQDSAASFRTITTISDVPSAAPSRESASSVHFSDQLTISRPTSDGLMISGGLDLSYDHRYETNSLPRQRCDRHRHEFHTYSLPRRPATATAATRAPQPAGHPHMMAGHSHYHHHHHHHAAGLAVGGGTGASTSIDDIAYSESFRDSASSLHSEPEAEVPDADFVQHADTALYDRPSRLRQIAVAEHYVAAATSATAELPSPAATLQRRRSTITAVVQPVAPVSPSPSDDYCSTCESSDSGEEAAKRQGEDDEESEQEIIIDFKPRISPVVSPRRGLHKKRSFQKQLSEGELQFNQRLESSLLAIGSASEKDLKRSDGDVSKASPDTYEYRDEPIHDEGVCEKCSPPLLRVPTGDELLQQVARQRREAFRKRSVSLEGGSVTTTTTGTDENEEDGEDAEEARQGGVGEEEDVEEEEDEEEEEEEEEEDDEDGPEAQVEDAIKVCSVRPAVGKSYSPPSPCMDELSVSRGQSNFPSTDSLAIDPTRDHSDSIWNESQATVLHADRSPSESAHSLITPTSKRKNLLLQHQQRSSMDTEALEMEDIFAEQQHLKQLASHAAHMQTLASAAQTSTTPSSSSAHQPRSHAAQPPMAPPPSIAVTPSALSQADQPRLQLERRASSTASTDASSQETSRRSSSRSRPVTPVQVDVHRSATAAPAPITSAATESGPSARPSRKSSLDPYATVDSLHQQLLLSHGSDSLSGGRTTNTDISECSTTTTNTEEYVSCCTESSLRQAATPTPAGRKQQQQQQQQLQQLQHQRQQLQHPGQRISVASSGTSTTYVAVSAHSSKPPSSTSERRATGEHGANGVVDGTGSSFESASSLYSLARDAEPGSDASANPLLDDTLPLPPTPGQLLRGPSPSLSIASSTASTGSSAASASAGSFARTRTTKDAKERSNKSAKSISPQTISTITSPASVDTVIAMAVAAPRSTTTSDYDETPVDEATRLSRQRRLREWNEEERRRRKEKMRLDIERENLKSLVPTVQSVAKESVVETKPATLGSPLSVGGSFKQISPDDPAAMNVLDGTSPMKTRRFRPKARKAIRARSINDADTLPRRVRTPIVIRTTAAAEDTDTSTATTGTTATATSSKCSSHFSMPCQPPVLRARGLVCQRRAAVTGSPAKRLKARSTESLRSVSPGSDSVFYSESAEAGLCDHHVQCQHCGKQVDIVTAGGGGGAVSESQETIASDGTSAEDLMVVKPPAGFGDSPDGPRSPQTRKGGKMLVSEGGAVGGGGGASGKSGMSGARLYKKMDKRFRSEERHAGEKRLYRSRQESARAKSEERGKDNAADVPMRPAGSTPCVAQLDRTPGGVTATYEEEHGIYLAYYRFRRWVCVVDTAVVAKRDIASKAELRDTTEHEREFRRIYAAITHRMVHRKSMLDMYHRQGLNIFSTDKTVIVRRVSGEFGFRIHGSQPVVISAIEPDTPAESSGLEVGDIILTVNGVSVVDKTHSEVVKIAHTGSDVLEISVARTAAIIASESLETGCPSVCSGYLWRLNQAQAQQPGGGEVVTKKSQKWVRRWFQLRPDNCLYFYKTEGDTHPVGAIVLTKHTVEPCSADIGRPFAFRIYINEGLPLYLAADNEEAANRWVAVATHAAKQCDPWLEMSTRNMKLPPNSIPRPDCFGYLMKLGTRWRTWSKRYCVLKDACLYFYHDGNSRSAFGMACLQGYRMQKPSNVHGKSHVFEISSPDPKFRSYQFCTESEMDKKRWLAALEYSIDRWMKAS